MHTISKPLIPLALLVIFLLGTLNAADTPKEDRPLRVCIVTGDDYHPWRATAPMLREMLEQDKQITVRIVETPEILGTDLIDDYDVLLLHFKNQQPLHRDAKIRENLTRFVKQGGGLVLFHFACGAFQEWPEFVELAGRVWNPKMPPHDPRGPFTVRITDTEHPITQGLADFTIDDELYTCLDGKPRIRVLATATSKVDGKAHPIAFTHQPGKGRVFQVVLGHDKKSLTTGGQGLAQLLRRGVLWVGKKQKNNPKY